MEAKLENNRELELFEFNRKGCKKTFKETDKKAKVHRKLSDEYYEESKIMEKQAKGKQPKHPKR